MPSKQSQTHAALMWEFLYGVNPKTLWTFGNSGKPESSKPDPVPEVRYLESTPAASGWSTIICKVDGRRRTIQWQPGIKRTEEHLGSKYKTYFGASVYRDLYLDIDEGSAKAVRHDIVEFEDIGRSLELYRFDVRDGIWWALKDPAHDSKSARVVGCGFIAHKSGKYLVQSAMFWLRADRRRGYYQAVLQRVREWVRPSTIYSDITMSAQAVMSWERSVRDGHATWDEKEGRYRRNPGVSRFVNR